MSEKLELLDEKIFAWTVSLNIHVKYLYKVGCAYIPKSITAWYIGVQEENMKICIYTYIFNWKSNFYWQYIDWQY